MTRKKDTDLAHTGSRPRENFGVVNPPVYHASTITFPTVAAMQAAERDKFGTVFYGRYGTPTTFAFEEAVAKLEGGEKCVALPSGMAAIACALMAFVKKGDHVLMTDNAYHPSIRFCETILKNCGVETTYFDPMASANDIKKLLHKNTRVVFCEAPGSITFEVQDIPAIAEVAHAHGALVMMDNTWSAGMYYRPFECGVDLSIQAATKYIVGHSDAMLGTITMAAKHFETVKQTAASLGYSAAPDDCYLGLRGIRSLSARMERHEKNAMAVATWLKSRDEVEAVLHPAFADCPGHEIWQRDFTGASGLFSIVLKEGPSPHAMAAMLDGMELFAMGYSWGGFESLIIPANPAQSRTAYAWPYKGPLLRLHVGQEDPQDLIDDLQAGFKRLK